MVFTTRVNLIVLPLVALLGISASLLGDAAKAFPVYSPSSFKSYLNSETSWRDGYKIKFNSVSECYRTYKNNGKTKAYICKNGEVSKISPKGERSTCRISLVRLTRKGKLKLTTADCRYR